MSPYAEHASGLVALQAELKDECPTFRWGGLTYLACPGGAALRRELGDGGFGMGADLTLSVAVSQFEGKTAAALQHEMSGTELVYLDRTYRITGVTITTGGHTLRLECTGITT